jgi:DNA primase
MSIASEIKQKLDIVEIVSEYVTLQKSGHNFKAICPFHSEKTPSFFVFPDNQSWHCFGSCGTGGDVFSFVMKKENIDFAQSLKLLAEKAGISLAEFKVPDKARDERRERLHRLNEAAAAYYHHLLLHTPAGKKAIDYLSQRGLSAQSIEQFQLGFSKDSYEDIQHHLLSENYTEQDLLDAGMIIERESGGYYDRFRNRIMFPIRDIRGNVTGFGARAMDDSTAKYINSPQTTIFDKSSSLYAIDRASKFIRQSDMVVITEGYMDVITAHQHGIQNTVAAMGTALTEKQLDILKKFSKNIVLALDADSAGIEAVFRSGELFDKTKTVTPSDMIDGSITGLLAYEVKVVVLPQGKDLDQVIREDETQWHHLLHNARPIIDFLFSNAIARIDLNSAQDKSMLVDKFIPLLSGIKDTIRQAHYIHQLATLLKINDKVIEDVIIKSRISRKTRKTVTRLNDHIHIIDPSLLSSPLEEYCLALLFQFPSLREQGKNISPEYLDLTENRELFLKWLNNDKLEHNENGLDNILQQHLHDLLQKELPAILKDSEEAQQKDFAMCTTRLKERWLRNVELKKALFFAEGNGTNEQLARLSEKGIEEHKQLKEIFDSRDTKRETTA